jgi:hypothetical protein
MRDTYFPDVKEPHIHTHKGGVTFTSDKHSHKNLQDGDKVLKNNCNNVIEELQNGNEREKSIAQWIQKNLL